MLFRSGLSAYEIAVMRGNFNGSEGEWLEYMSPEKIEVDASLSETSKNPVENRITTNELQKKQPLLVSGKNIKTINGKSILGEGDIAIEGGDTSITVEDDFGESTENPGSQRLITEVNKSLDNVSKSVNAIADDEDLILVESGEQEEHTIKKLKFADKAYNASAFSGMGRVYLRKNIIGGKNVLTQAIIGNANTRYIIQYDYDLNGQTINVPEGCMLDFQGGSLKNGTIIGYQTTIREHPNYNIFNDCKIKNFELDYIDIRWTGAISDFDGVSGTDCSQAFSRALENIVKYHLGIRLLVVGSYYIANQVTTNMDFNIIGYHFPTRILVGHSNEPDVVEKSPSLLYVKEGITAFELNGLGGTALSSAHATHISITNLLLKSSGKTSKFFNCTTFGTPSRPGYCQNVEATGFDKVFNFTFKDGANTYGTNYYNFSIGQGCNFYKNNESLYAIGRAGTSPSLGGLSVQDGVFEHGASMNLKNLFGYNRICNNLMEGQENPLSISLNKGNIDICGNYFEACTGKISISSSVLSNRIKVNGNYMHNTPDFGFSLFNATLIGLNKEFSSVSLSNVIVEDKSIIENINANAVKSVYPSKFSDF